MSSISTKVETQTHEDAEGNITTTTKETSISIQRNQEPDYIKLYTKMWCEFNCIPARWQQLFLELAIRMNYTNTHDLEHSQIVIVYGSQSDDIVKACGWADKSTLRKGLKALCDCNAIRKVRRAEYQINPNYAGRGEWKYNARLKRGGVEDLVATFNFKKGTVSTSILWSDDGEDTATNTMMRDGLGVRPSEETVLKTTDIKASDDLPGQMTIDELKGA